MRIALKEREKKNRSNEFLPDPEQRIPKIQQKKTLMASFQARIDWERLGERENKKKMFR